MALRTELKKQGDFLFRHRSYLPVIILLAGLYLYVINETAIIEVDESQRRAFEIACFLVGVLGFVIRIISIGYTADNTSGRNTTEGQVADTINQTGPYALCRHPLYLGNFFIWLAIAGFTQNLWFILLFVLIYWIYYERIVYAEEAYLISKYGDQYEEYSQNVPPFFPRLGNWVKPKLSFSWRKIIRQEKAGILNLFLVIALFRVAREYYENEPGQIERYWLYGLGLSVLYYIVVKVIQKTSNALDADR